MNKLYIPALFLSLMLIAGACGSSSSSSITNVVVPEWILNTPVDDDYFFGTGNTTSRDMSLAVTKSATEARIEIAQQIEVKMSGMQRRFQEEVGLGENSELLDQFTNAYKAVADETLVGSRIINQEIRQEGSIYRAFVLVEMPVGAASEAMMQRLRENENLYTRFRATEAFRDLERELEEYRDQRNRP
ncbi:LPP20 lipoprotein [Cyclonatronum proteinivorum]|uniref:LPP20 lipoprotein n=1 Tax=Cyclonatronum proteinivorum TaxID=1457365 RepID=A0A345UPM4_9BACT|nr:LPP20 family lipoprotein [Cyclonatronum proteinivorum]AXJ02426.1 LPP20 lipoprotein [Cyclonatronum proteinivorum]